MYLFFRIQGSVYVFILQDSGQCVCIYSSGFRAVCMYLFFRIQGSVYVFILQDSGQCVCIYSSGFRAVCMYLFFRIQGSVYVFILQDSGQCVCRSNVMGRRCDQCEDTYWDITSAGCSRMILYNILKDN